MQKGLKQHTKKPTLHFLSPFEIFFFLRLISHLPFLFSFETHLLHHLTSPSITSLAFTPLIPMSESDKPTVLIIGAGLGGLLFGALLEKADIPYTIFERVATVKPLGMHQALFYS